MYGLTWGSFRTHYLSCESVLLPCIEIFLIENVSTYPNQVQNETTFKVIS